MHELKKFANEQLCFYYLWINYTTRRLGLLHTKTNELDHFQIKLVLSVSQYAKFGTVNEKINK